MKKLLSMTMIIVLVLSGVLGGFAVAEEVHLALRLPLGFVWVFDEFLNSYYTYMAGGNADTEAIAAYVEEIGLDIKSMRTEEDKEFYSSPSGLYEVCAVMNEQTSLVGSYELIINMGEYYADPDNHVTEGDMIGIFITVCQVLIERDDDNMRASLWWMGECPTSDYIGDGYTIHYELDENGLSHFVFNFES